MWALPWASLVKIGQVVTEIRAPAFEPLQAGFWGSTAKNCKICHIWDNINCLWMNSHYCCPSLCAHGFKSCQSLDSALFYGLQHRLTLVLFNECNNSIIPRSIFSIGYVRAKYFPSYYYSSISKLTTSIQFIFPFSSYHPAQLTHYPFPTSSAGRLWWPPWLFVFLSRHRASSRGCTDKISKKLITPIFPLECLYMSKIE